MPSGVMQSRFCEWTASMLSFPSAPSSVLLWLFLWLALAGGSGEVARAEEGGADGASKGWSYALSLVGAYQYQDKRVLQTNPDSIYDLSAFKGSSAFFALDTEYEFASNWAARVGLFMRETHLEGDARPRDIATSYRFSLQHQFTGVELSVRYTRPEWSGLSMIGSVERASGKSVKMEVLSGPPVDSREMVPPNFTIISCGLIYSRPLSKRWSVEPTAKAGMVTTTLPPIFLAQGLLSFRWK